MPRKSNQQKLKEAMLAGMTDLVLLPAFQNWIELLKQTKDGAVQYMVDHTAIANERESLVARGEVRAYLTIIHDYEAQREQLEAQIKSEAEQRGG